MKIEQTRLEDHQIQIHVVAEQDTFDKAKHMAAKEMAKNKKIPGYRPGKAPYQLIVNHFGEAAIIDQALDHFLDEIYPKILDQVEEEPYGPGRVKEIETLEPPTIVLEIPLQPEVILGNYQDIRIPYQETEVDEGEMNEIVDRLRTQQAAIEPVDHPAEESSLVDTSLSGYPVDADPEDQDAYLLNEQPLPVMIKSETDPTEKEWPFPGFSRQLLGVSSGDELELSYEFPDEETVDEEYRGKEIIYKVKVKGIRQRVLPELDDKFIQSISDHESVKEFMDQLKEDLAEQKEREDQDEYLTQIFEKILEDTEVKFPPQMLENEVEGEINELTSRLESQGMELATYLAMQDMDEETLRQEIRPGAEKRIQRGLVIGRISEDANLDISTEEITQEYQALLDNYFGENDEERQAFMSSNQSISLLNQISSQVISRKTIDFLVALAKGEDITPYQKKEDEDQNQEEVQDDVESEEEKVDQPDSEKDELEREDETKTGDESENK